MLENAKEKRVKRELELVSFLLSLFCIQRQQQASKQQNKPGTYLVPSVCNKYTLLIPVIVLVSMLCMSTLESKGST